MGEKGIQTKKAICAGAYALFAARGFQAVTMKDICDATGLSRGGLYRHFDSTKQIFEEILQEISVGSADWMEEEAANGKSAKAVLESALLRIQKEMKEPETALSYAIYEYSIKENSKYMEQINQRAKNKWRELLERGTKEGDFKICNVEAVVDMLLYVYQGVRMWSRIIPLSDETAEHIVEQIRSQIY